MSKDRIEHLIHLYVDGSCTAAELNELKSRLMDLDDEAYFNAALDKMWDKNQGKEEADLGKDKSDLLFEKIITTPQKNKSTRRIWPTFAAAAVLLISLSASLLFYLNNFKETPHTSKLSKADFPDAIPGGNKAMITLPNGEVINLRNNQDGVEVHGDELVYADGTSVFNAQNGLGYNIEEKGIDNPANSYVEFSTPIGGIYHIILSDGTKVVLNSESKLRYPIHFDKKSRVVELDGEGYFEVSKSKDQPFIVRSKGQEVKVLGTGFNISAYADNDAVKTTLVHGSVEVSRKIRTGENREAVILKPGQQSELNVNRSGISLREVDVTEIMDWKEGLFLFNNEPIKDIMKRVSRWYDVEVVYSGNMDDIRFVGSYSRNKNLKNLLKNIELTGKVVFKVEDDNKGKERRIMIIANY